MNALVTGGAGFIGSHLVDRMLKTHWKVTAIDDLSTGCIDNLASAFPSPKFSFRHASVLDEAIVNDVIASADLVVHLAAAVGVRLVMQNPLRTIETNVRGTEVVLNAAAKNNTRVLFASTSEVYGPTTESPLRETANIMCGSSTRSRWSYAISKALGEFLALAHRRESGLSVTIVRLFNTVGPRQTDRYGMVLPVLVRQALLGKSLTVHGSGMQRRCFAYIDDVIDALMRIIDSTSCAGEIINIGNDTEVTILDLARMVLEQTRSDSSVQLVPYDVAYPPGFEETFARVPCLQKLEGLTGYRPRTPLAVALDAVIHDLRQRPGAAGNPRRLVAGAD